MLPTPEIFEHSGVKPDGDSAFLGLLSQLPFVHLLSGFQNLIVLTISPICPVLVCLHHLLKSL